MSRPDRDRDDPPATRLAVPAVFGLAIGLALGRLVAGNLLGIALGVALAVGLALAWRWLVGLPGGGA